MVVLLLSLHCVLLAQAMLQSVHSAMQAPGLMHFCPLVQFASLLHIIGSQLLLQHVVPLLQLTSVAQFSQFSFCSTVKFPQLAKQSLSLMLVQPFGQCESLLVQLVIGVCVQFAVQVFGVMQASVVALLLSLHPALFVHAIAIQLLPQHCWPVWHWLSMLHFPHSAAWNIPLQQ